jgi:hypothetical protein
MRLIDELNARMCVCKNWARIQLEQRMQAEKASKAKKASRQKKQAGGEN